jgi:hypothetical protein
METFGDKILAKTSKFFCCKNCDYVTSRKSNIESHYLTAKHKKTLIGDDGNKNKQNSSKNKQILNNFICENCNKKYISRNGLWKHKVKGNCNNSIIESNKNECINDTSEKELINYLIKENQEFKNMMMKVLENSINNTNNITTHTNSHNKTFNLQFFLNETCKNAMNITDFVDSIKLQLADLENVGKIGYVEGLSNIIIKNLNNMDITERPVHCSDSKRETMYVKHENKWEKDAEENHKVIKAIEDIANKNTKLISEWKKQNPECASSKSAKADQYSHILIEALCSNNDANNQKVLKKIAKEVIIDKTDGL